MIIVDLQDLGLLFLDKVSDGQVVSLLELLGENLIVMKMPSLDKIMPATKVPGFELPEVGLKVVKEDLRNGMRRRPLRKGRG